LLIDLTVYTLNYIYSNKANYERNSALSSPPQDSAFSDAKVLLLFPYKKYAHQFIENIIELHCKGKRKKINKQSRAKYSEEYEAEEDVRAM